MDNGLDFEQRQEIKPENSRVNDIEYNRGGGGGEPTGFFAIKTNVYSRQCFNDPNNPGKMICKEMTNSSGFDPFHKENNYKRSKENVYTQELGSNGSNYYQSIASEEPSFFEKLSGKIKGIFSEPDENDAKITKNENFTNFANSNIHNKVEFPFNHHHNNPNDDNLGFGFGLSGHIHSDPILDQFERMFKNMQSAFIKDIFHDDEDDPLESFFRGGNFSSHFDSSFNRPNQFNQFNHRHSDYNDRFYHPNTNTSNHTPNFYNHNHQEDNFHHSNHYEKQIKYSDNKIYDV